MVILTGCALEKTNCIKQVSEPVAQGPLTKASAAISSQAGLFQRARSHFNAVITSFLLCPVSPRLSFWHIIIIFLSAAECGARMSSHTIPEKVTSQYTRNRCRSFVVRHSSFMFHPIWFINRQFAVILTYLVFQKHNLSIWFRLTVFF